MDESMESSKASLSEGVKHCEASFSTNIVVQDLPSGTNEMNNVIGAADTDTDNTKATNTDNDHADENKQRNITFKGFPYIFDHVGKTYVRWRCQRPGSVLKRCQALISIGKYRNEVIHRRFNHDCIYMTKNWTTVTVVNKSHPENWTVVPNDLTNIVIYTHEAGHKIIYYNKAKYSNKLKPQDDLLFKCMTLPTCKAELKLKNADPLVPTSKMLLLEKGEHSCNVLQRERRYRRQKRMLEIRKCKTQFVHVNVINYIYKYDQDLKTLLRLQVVPELDPNDSTSIIRYLNEDRKKVVYYKGYEYILKKKKNICYNSVQCKARLIVRLKTSKVLEFGKHTCNGNNTTLIKLETGDESQPNTTINSLSNCNKISQLSLDIKGAVDEIETFYENKYDLNSCNGVNGDISINEAVSVTNSSTTILKSFEVKDSLETKEHTTVDDGKNEDAALTTDVLSYKPVKIKDYSKRKNVSYIPKLEPDNSSIVTVYMDKGFGNSLEKLIHYNGYTYLDYGQKTGLYMCQSLTCCGALKINALRTEVGKVGTHNCTMNNKSVTNNCRNFKKSQPNTASCPETQTSTMADTHILNTSSPGNRQTRLKSEISKSSKGTTNSPKNNSHTVGRPDQSVPKFFEYNRKKYCYYQKYIYVEKLTTFHSYPVYMCTNTPCWAAIKRFHNKKGFISMGAHSCVAIPDKQSNIFNQNTINKQACTDSNIINLDEDTEILNMDTVEIDEVQINPEIKVERDDANINDANSAKQDHRSFKTELQVSLDDNICNKTHSSNIYIRNLPMNDIDGQKRTLLNLPPNSNNSSLENYLPVAPTLLGEPRFGVIPDARLSDNLNADFAAAQLLGPPYVPTKSKNHGKETLPPTSQVDLSEPWQEKRKKVAPDAVFRKVKVTSYLEKNISYNSLEELEIIFMPDSDGDQEYEIAVFRDEKNKQLFYYKGHTYLADAKTLSMCSNYPCSAALRVCYSETVVEVAQLGVHDCYLTDAEIASVDRLRNSSESEVPVTASSTSNKTPNVAGKRVHSVYSKGKTKEYLLLHRRVLKAHKSKYDNLIEKVKKTRNIEIINHLLTKFVKVPLEEQTEFSMTYDNNKAFIIFRGFTHQRIRIDTNTNQSIISYICTKFKDLCDGSLLMADNRVIEFRDHFCEGRECSNIPTDKKTLSIYYNAANACPELSYKGFKYWNAYWDKWKVPDGSYWVCSQEKCFVYLKITDNMIGQLRQHQCISSHVIAKKNIERKAKGTTEELPFFVNDIKGNSCMIYNGYVYRLEKRETSLSFWVCIKKQSNDCSALLRINKGKVSLVSNHCCCELDTINNGHETEENNSNIAAKHLLNLCHTETSDLFQQNRTWHYLPETQVDEIMLFYALAVSKYIKKPKYIFYQGYIYRFVGLITQGFQRGDCIYGGSNSSCRGVLTCKNYIPIAVSNHSCREERGGRLGEKHSDGETIINQKEGIQVNDLKFTQETKNEIENINEPLRPGDKEQYLPFTNEENQITDSIDIKEEGVQEILVDDNYMSFETSKSSVFDNQEEKFNILVENEKMMNHDALPLVYPNTSSCDRKRKATATVRTNDDLSAKLRRRQLISNFDHGNVAYTEEIYIGNNTNLEESDSRPDEDIEATLPCTIIRSVNNLGGNSSNVVIEISDDEA